MALGQERTADNRAVDPMLRLWIAWIHNRGRVGTSMTDKRVTFKRDSAGVYIASNGWFIFPYGRIWIVTQEYDFANISKGNGKAFDKLSKANKAGERH